MPPVDQAVTIILFHWQLLSHLTGIAINWPDCSNNFIWLAMSLRLATVGLTVTIFLFYLQHLSCLKGITIN
jgi:hypothetical protein